jgi:hypothetical protein
LGPGCSDGLYGGCTVPQIGNPPFNFEEIEEKMKRTLVVECTLNGDKGMVMVGPAANGKVDPDPILDTGILCEAICTLIRICHKSGIKDESDSVRDCIDHLKKGFIDETFKVEVGNLTSEDQLKFKERIDSLLS